MNTRARKKPKAHQQARDDRKLRYKIPLVAFERHIDTVDLADQAGMERLIEKAAAANDGTALREYVDEVEDFSRKIFDEARIMLDDRYNRCKQIVQEYENPSVALDEENRKILHARFGYMFLQHDQIDSTIYCAARVLISVRYLRKFIRDALSSDAELQIVTPNAGRRMRPTYARFAIECMTFEGKYQQLITTLGYLHKHGGKKGREARKAEAEKRRKDIKELDQKKTITEADYSAIRLQHKISQKTLKRDLDEIRGKLVRR